MQLRFYQQDAYDAAIASLGGAHHPVLQLATGTGKSLIIAAIAEHYKKTDRRVWVLTHVQQLVEQNAVTYERYSGFTPGIVCAGLKRKDRFEPVTFATIQSILGVQAEMHPPDLIIIDEAHRVPHRQDSALSRDQHLAVGEEPGLASAAHAAENKSAINSRAATCPYPYRKPACY